MILERTQDPRWLSNTWLVGDRPGGKAVLIDTGGPIEPIEAALREHRLTLTHVLCTHHHIDHVAHNADYVEAHRCAVCAHPAELPLFERWAAESLPASAQPTLALSGGDELATGDLRIRALHVPGHTLGQLAFLVNEERVFTGDTLFRGSVGGTRATGHGSFEQLVHSICDVLLELPPGTRVHPGHVDETTIERERAENPFVRAWRGLDLPRSEACTALGQPARLLLRARDYDGGTKCWVRFEDGREDVVPGSRVVARGLE